MQLVAERKSSFRQNKPNIGEREGSERFWQNEPKCWGEEKRPARCPTILIQGVPSIRVMVAAAKIAVSSLFSSVGQP
jgi:hypothetical protein